MFEDYVKSIKDKSIIKQYLGLIKRFIKYKVYRLKYYKFTSGSGKIEENVYIDKKCIIGAPQNISIGKGTVITKANLDARGGIEIENNCIINDGVKIISATHDYNSSTYDLIKKKVKIGEYSWLATDSMILPGVTIGKGAIVGAGTVVAKDIPEMAICVGNPAKIIGYRERIHYDVPICSYVGLDYKYYLQVLKGEVYNYE